MKLNKIAAIALAALFMTSCSDDDSDKLNSAAGVTVDMGKATYTTRENSSIFKLPVEVKGATNGNVIINVETAPTPGEEAAIADENYIVTSYRVIIPAGAETGEIEIRPVDNADENESRFFTVTIKSAEGATVGSQNSTVVEIKDNDQDPYEKLTGKWNVTAFELFDEAYETFTLDIQTPDPESEYFGHELYAYGLLGRDYLFIPINYEFNEVTEEMTLSLQVGSFATESLLNFTGIGQAVVVGSSNLQANMNFGEDVPLTLTMDGNKVTTMATGTSGTWGMKVVPYPALNECKGFFDAWQDLTFSR